MKANTLLSAAISYAFLTGVGTIGLILRAMDLFSGGDHWMNLAFVLACTLVTGWFTFFYFKQVSNLLKSAVQPKS